MSCDNDCTRPAAFPRVIDNRPALPRIGYRIGAWSDMRAHLLGLIDAAPALAGWTHRTSDDPGIALVEAIAMVGDVLALYQDDYANEAYLRTATQPDGIGALVRLLGYRPAPGIGGNARFALAVKGAAPVAVPAGLSFEAPIEGRDKPSTFETDAAITALPGLSTFHLHRPRRLPDIVNGIDSFQLAGARAPALKPGDRIVVGLAHGAAANRAYDHTQVLVVDKVWEAYGMRCIRTRGRIDCLSGSGFALATLGAAALAPAALSSAALVSAAASAISTPSGTAVAIVAPALTGLSAVNHALSASIASLPAYAGLLSAGIAVASVASAPSLVAWKVGSGDSRHFGHQAPAVRVEVDADGRASEVAVGYERTLAADQGDPAGPRIQPLQLPLEGRAAEMAAGIGILVEADLKPAGNGSARKRLLARRVRQIDTRSLAWGAQTGSATVLTLDADLAIAEPGVTLDRADVRSITVRAVEGDAFALQALPVATSAASGSTLDFYGSDGDALALQDRTLLLAEPRAPLAVRVQRVRRQPAGEARWELTLDRSVDYALYPHDAPAVDVYGNLVDASEGKTEAEVALGDGDGRLAFQTFVLPKAPLTYRLDPAASPPRRPELTIRVDGLLWQRVDSFFDSAAHDRVYLVREGDDGKSRVQFGDGVHGARLPSGQGNVVARYRSGNGSRGALKAGATVSAKPRFAGFDRVALLEPVTGGAQPEASTSVRLAAPGTMQSLGRIVSLADCEAEAQALPGVLKARATWSLLDGAPALTLTVLTDGLADADRLALEGALRAAFATRGPARCALRLRLGNRRFADVALRVGYDARLRVDDLLPALQRALGTSPDDIALDDEPTGGLFDWRERDFGEDVHGSQVVGRVQNVAGIAWVELQRLLDRSARGLVAGTLSPLALPAVQRRLRCPGDSLLALEHDRLAIEWIAVAVTGAPP